MPGEFSLTSFAAFATGMTVALDKIQRDSLERGAKIVEEEAKRVIGTYDYGWPQLADATKEDRIARGYTPNDPGLREGDMQESIEHKVVSHNEASIGSDDDKLVYFDLGTKTQPPRPVLEPAAIAKEKEIATEFGKRAHAALTSNDSEVRKYLPPP